MHTLTTLRTFIVSTGLLAITLMVYWPAATFAYVDLDDSKYASRNEHVQGGLDFEGVRWALTTDHASNWHPLTWLSLMLDTTLLGNHAMGHHAINVAIHGLNVLLLFHLLARLTGAFWPSALVGALLATHPIHVESVAWISERKDVLSLFFWLATIWAYARYAKVGGAGPYLLTVLLFSFGLMSKPSVVSLPFVLMLLDVWPLGRTTQPWFSAGFVRQLAGLALEKAPMFVLAALVSAVTVIVQDAGDSLVLEGTFVPFGVRLQNVAVSYVLYVARLFWPGGLAVLYPNAEQIERVMWQPWQWILSTAALVATTLIAVRADRRPYLAVGWLWFLGTMVPVIGFVQIGRHSMADRYAYIPFIGLYIAIAWSLGELSRRARTRAASRMTLACIGAGLAACAVLAHRQVWIWRDSITLFEHATHVTKDNWYMHAKLADTLAIRGRFADAISHYEQAIGIFPACAWLRSNYAAALAEVNRKDDALAQLDQARQIDPDNAMAHLNMGILLCKYGEFAMAVDPLRRAVGLDPWLAEGHRALALALAATGRRADAIAQVRTAMDLWPSERQHWQALIDDIEHSRAPEPRAQPGAP